MESISTLHSAVRWGAPGITLLGVLVGICGTLLMSRPYHPYSTWRIIPQVFRVVFAAVRKGKEDAERLIQETSVLAEVNTENRARTLFGLYVLIVSFFLQTIGAVLAMIDTIWKR